MHEFLKNEEIDAKYHKLIKASWEDIFLVTPWYQPTKRFKDNIEDCLRERDVQLHLITRPRDTESPIHRENIEELEKLCDSLGKVTRKQKKGILRSEEVKKDRLFITYVPHLHAKILVINRGEAALLSSFNLIETSSTTNIEAGILFYDDSSEVIEDILEFIFGLKKKYGSIKPDEIREKKCEKCDNLVSSIRYPFCRNCHTKIKQGTTCPKCGDRKNPGYLYCKPCKDKQQQRKGSNGAIV